jgi:hypothetical protein
MARKVNPEVEQLELQVKLLRGESARLRQPPGDMPFNGCGDNSCELGAPGGGMRTNGGCRCDERELRRALRWWRRRAEFLQVTVQDMREGLEAVGETTSANPATCGATTSTEEGMNYTCIRAVGHDGAHSDHWLDWPASPVLTVDKAHELLDEGRRLQDALGPRVDAMRGPADDGLLHDRVHVPGGGLIKATPIREMGTWRCAPCGKLNSSLDTECVRCGPVKP